MGIYRMYTGPDNETRMALVKSRVRITGSRSHTVEPFH